MSDENVTREQFEVEYTARTGLPVEVPATPCVCGAAYCQGWTLGPFLGHGAGRPVGIVTGPRVDVGERALPRFSIGAPVELPDHVFSKAEVIDLVPGSSTFGVRYRVQGPPPNVNIGGRGVYVPELDEPCDCDDCYVEPTEAEVRDAERRLTGQGPA